jgi:hypothetical protein
MPTLQAMGDEWGPQPSPIRPCSVEHNFQFVAEMPARGFQPGQRFHIRSHVMKQYKRNQRQLNQVDTRKIPRARSKKHATIVRRDPVDDDESEEENQPQADATALGMNGSGLPQRQKPLSFIASSSRSRPAVFTFKPSKQESCNPSSSEHNRTHEELQSRRPNCGAPQFSRLGNNQKRVMNQSTATGPVLWRRSVKPDPLSLLGAGRVDPFRSCPVDETSPQMHELMDHSKFSSYFIPTSPFP